MSEQNAPKNVSNLTQIILPDKVLGPIKKFSNFDPTRIQHYELVDNEVHLYINELDRLQALQEFKSTIEAFRYEVDRRVRPEIQSFKSFHYTDDFNEFTFVVSGELFKDDVSAMMIERSIVEDAIRYQLYAKKKIGVRVIYKDAYTNHVIREKVYPKELKI